MRQCKYNRNDCLCTICENQECEEDYCEECELDNPMLSCTEFKPQQSEEAKAVIERVNKLLRGEKAE